MRGVPDSLLLTTPCPPGPFKISSLEPQKKAPVINENTLSRPLASELAPIDVNLFKHVYTSPTQFIGATAANDLIQSFTVIAPARFHAKVVATHVALVQQLVRTVCAVPGVAAFTGFRVVALQAPFTVAHGAVALKLAVVAHIHAGE